uniref:Uncharacterized protein n=1 Tax=Rhizophora mucronata TaxID=61149 RepID=A0A2P2N180_RHIMU
MGINCANVFLYMCLYFFCSVCIFQCIKRMMVLILCRGYCGNHDGL